MSEFGKRMIEALKQGIAIARGEADPASYDTYTLTKDGKLHKFTKAEKVKRAKQARKMFADARLRRTIPASSD